MDGRLVFRSMLAGIIDLNVKDASFLSFNAGSVTVRKKTLKIAKILLNCKVLAPTGHPTRGNRGTKSCLTEAFLSGEKNKS